MSLPPSHGLRTSLLGAAAVLGTAVASNATPITSLFNTGVDASGVAKANLTPESHYALTSAPANAAAGLRVATAANGFPIPPWLGDNATSAWIGPDSGGQLDLDGPVGNYTYRTTFNLTGLIPSTASIAGQWSVDNAGIGIVLNGVPFSSTAANFQNFYAFNLSTGFVDGLNTLDFIAHNDGGPTGLRVAMTGNADTVSVPEPVSLSLLGSGLCAAGLFRRKRV